MKNKVNQNISGIYPLTPLQHAMVFYKMLDGEANSYVEQSTFQVKGDVDMQLVRETLNLLACRYEALRSAIVYEGVEEPVQVAFREREVECNYYDISKEENIRAKAEQMKEDDVKRDFNLAKDSLLRVTYLKTAPKEYTVLWNFHHVIMDGWSFGLVQGDFQEYYRQLLAGKSATAIQKEIDKERSEKKDYGDYLKWLSQRKTADSMNYWKKLLEPCNEVSDIPAMYRKTSSKNDVGTETYLMEDQDFKKIQTYAKENKVTMNTMVETAFSILVHLYSRNETISFGKVVSGRDSEVEGINEMVGLFVNTIPVAVRFPEDITVRKLIEEVNQQAIESTGNAQCSLGDIQNQSALKGDLIKLLYVFENYYVDDSSVSEGIPGMEITMESAREKTNYNLSFMANAGENLGFKIIYNPQKYEREEIILFLKRVETILIEMAEYPDSLLSQLSFVTEKEEDRILHEFNQTATGYPKDKTVSQLFEEIADAYPDSIAVESEEETVTYRELNERANQVARRLRMEGVGNDVPVAIFAEKNVALITGLLGIIKAGGAYVPIDTELPDERMKYILDDCKPSVILGKSDMETAYQGAVRIPLTDSSISSQSKENLDCVNTGDSLIYFIYTSGTTGNPKGTMIEHKCVVRLVRNENYVPLDSDTVILQGGAISFDASTFEVWGSLLNGGKLCLVSKDSLLNPKAFKEALVEGGVNTIFLTTTLFNQMVNSDPSVFDSLKYLLTGGEKISEEHVRIFKERNTPVILKNAYGPTESTTFATFYDITDEDKEIPIGKPISNTTVYVADNGSLCGIGVPGELLIGGDGLARGYLNQPELTAEKFIQNPYGEGMVYRTGDLVKWLPDGNLAYLGRIDEQIKLRGFRIELTEVENILRKLNHIDNAAVVMRVDQMGEKCMCAFYEGSQAEEKQIRNEIAKYLPAYMIPSYFVKLEKLPVNQNGKCDKHALPEITMESKVQYVAPRNETETKIVTIFEKVLGIEKVSVQDNFFEIGGHSLRATRVVNEIEAVCAVKIPMKEMFQNPTAEQLAKLITSQEEEKAYEPIPKAEEKEYYQMSSAQKRIFLIDQMGDDKTIYNMPFQFHFEGKLDEDKLRAAYQQLVERNEVLRTRFVMKDNMAVQYIEKEVKAEVNHIQAGKEEINERFQAFIQPFDLDKPPLMRLEMVTIGEEETILFLDMHHIISDGMTMGLLMEELTKLYNGETLEKPNIQYKDYSEWMLHRDLTEQKEYWLKQFAGEIPVLDMPYDYPRPQFQSFRGRTIQISLTGKEKEYLEKFITKNKTTDYMVFLSTLMILLSKYSRQEDIIIGSAISARTHRDTERIMGMFVNTLAMRGKPEKEKRYIDFLQEVKENCLAAYENQEYPFDELIDELHVERDMSRNPLFDVMFAFQNNERMTLGFTDTKQKDDSDYENVVAKFDLTVNAAKAEDEYLVMFEYCSDLFTEDSMARFASNYAELLRLIVRYPNRAIGKLELITKEERSIVLHQFNKEPFDLTELQSIPAMFETVAERLPDHIAVCFQDKMLTYQELNERANKMAHLLQEHCVEKEDFVAVALDRGLDIVVAILAVIKAGGAYVPIDTEYPAERIRFILEDCKPKAVIAESTFAVETDITVIAPDSSELVDKSTENVVSGVDKDSLAYMIYTSGTTGKPKGTMIEEKGILRLVKYADYVELNEQTVILQTGAMSFDASTLELWGSLLNGGTLTLAESEVLTDPELLRQRIQDAHINTMWLTAALYNQMMDSDSSMFDSLTYLLIGGEKLSERHVKLMKERKNGVHLINGYGPTENTTFTATYEIPEEFSWIPIGTPVANTQIYIMNGSCLCGVKMPGELCIAGDGLSRGYLNRPELNEAKFEENPYGEGNLYRSGDLVRWHEDGTIEFMGRIDQQVKIHGFRIELEEIKNVILRQDGILDAAVIVRENQKGDKTICAYYVGEEKPELRATLEEELPHYMIPSFFQKIEKMPVTANGKVNVRELPDITAVVSEEYEEPRNYEEEVLCEAFASVLGMERISIQDNFFELGGDSIKAIQVVSKVREREMQLTVKQVMNYKTVRGIAKHVVKLEENQYCQDEVNGVTGLLPIQEEFFYHWEIGNYNHFNQSMFLRKDTFDRDALFHALQELMAHHDMLRAVYKDQTLQVLPISECSGYGFEEIEAYGQKGEELNQFVAQECTRIQKSISIEDGPLMKTALFLTDQGEHLFLCIHHLAIDGVSWRILTEDLQKGYCQYQKEGKIVLPAKTASFKEWVDAVHAFANTEEVMSHKAYWDEIAANTERANIQGDTESASEWRESYVEIDKEVTKTLLYEVGKKYNTEINDVLLTAVGLAIQKQTGQNEVSVYLEGHGRVDLPKKIDISRTVGWFTQAYPVILTMKKEVEDSLLHNKEMLHTIPEQGISYGLLEDTVGKIDLSFNYLGQVENKEEETTEEKDVMLNSELPTGENIAAEDRLTGNLILTGTAINEVMSFIIMYNAGKYSDAFVQSFEENFKAALTAIADMALSQEEAVCTLSDIEATDIEEDDLSEINSLIDGLDF